MTAPEQGRLMDNRAIRAELGVTESQADRIIRWCSQRSGTVKPADGARKLYVFRDDVDAWLEDSKSRSAA